MQDATLYEKSSTKHLANSQYSNTSFTNGKSNSESSSCTNSKSADLEKTNDLTVSENHKNNSMNSSVHMVASEATQSGAASLPSTSMMWSVAPVSPQTSSTLDETYVQGISSMNNGGTFQQFSTALSMNSQSSGIYNSGMAFSSNQVQTANAMLSQHGRRAITGHSSTNNIPRPQTNLMVNTCSNPKILPNWNNSHQSTWSTQPTQTSLYPPWNVQQRRSVPNMSALAPTATKKQNIQQQLQQSSYIVPSKFKRSTSFPGQIQNSGGVKNPYDLTSFDDVGYQVGT